MTTNQIDTLLNRIAVIERCAAQIAFCHDYKPDAYLFKYRRLVDLGDECRELRSALMDEFTNELQVDTDPVEIPEDEE